MALTLSPHGSGAISTRPFRKRFHFLDEAYFHRSNTHSSVRLRASFSANEILKRSGRRSNGNSCAIRSSLNSKSATSELDEVTIVGGGVAGLLMAISLQRAGIKFKVFEKSTHDSTASGTLITLFPNGLKSISSINPEITEMLKSRGAENFLSRSIGLDGTILREVELTIRAKYGHGMLGVRWSRILDTFREFLPKGSIYTGHSFTGKLTQEEDGVTAVFDNNGEEVSVKSSLLIGADGIHSGVRKAVLGDSNVSPRDNGQKLWRLIVPKSELQTNLFEANATTLALGEGRFFALSDCGEGLAFISFGCSDEFSKGETKIRSASPEESKAQLLKLFSDSPVLTPIIHSLNPDAMIERRMLDLPPLPHWRNGRVVLIGDAAHAVTPALGQGANLAFEDVVELTRQLLSHSSVEDALDAFVDIHKPRVESIAERNRAAGAKVREKKGLGSDNSEYIFGFDRLSQPVFLT